MLAIISHPDCLLHDTGSIHPEDPERIHAINNQIIMSGLEFAVRHYDAPYATKEDLLRVHDKTYLNKVEQLMPEYGHAYLDEDTVLSPHTLKAAHRAAGAGIMGVDLVMKNEANPVFCAIRPPGHHAEHDKAMGFCLFNNIAVATAYALETYKLKKVAIVDFDVHHGNGTEKIFKHEDRVLFCSSFQHPLYPYWSEDPDTKNLIAIPFSAATNGEKFRNAIQEHLLPALEKFQPELIFISAGFDAHTLDDMSTVNLTEDDYEWITKQIHTIAQKHANGRIVSMLEGGYEHGALARSAVKHLKALLG